MEPISKGIRLSNFIIDLLVIKLAILRYGVYPILRVVCPAIFTYSMNDIKYAHYLVNIAVFFIYYFGMEATTGQTFGKLLTRSKVATVDGYKPTTYDIFKRTIWRLVPFEPFSFLGVNGWHDSQSKTTLVSNIAVLNTD
jgi:uncharacterized RDD family membrane protein YckC